MNSKEESKITKEKEISLEQNQMIDDHGPVVIGKREDNPQFPLKK